MSKYYPNERDCKHGWLRRSCPHCEANEDMKRIEQLEDSNKQLLDALDGVMSDVGKSLTQDRYDQVQEAITNSKKVMGE